MTIGLRVYRVAVHSQADHQPRVLGTQPGQVNLLAYFRNRIRNVPPAVREEAGRSLHFTPSQAPRGTLHGVIEYGMFGFGSVLRERETRRDVFQRDRNHVEDIPLYYRIWIPEGETRGFAAFQSFQGRSCVDGARSYLVEGFNEASEETRLVIAKLTPTNAMDYGQSPVARLRLTRPRQTSDAAQNIFAENEEVDAELVLKRRSRAGLGNLEGVRERLVGVRRGGVLVYDGMEFTGAVADVRVGNKYIPISVIGPLANTGVIEVTDRVDLDAQGHPTLDSIAEVARDILEEYALEV